MNKKKKKAIGPIDNSREGSMHLHCGSLEVHYVLGNKGLIMAKLRNKATGKELDVSDNSQYPDKLESILGKDQFIDLVGMSNRTAHCMGLFKNLVEIAHMYCIKEEDYK